MSLGEARGRIIIDGSGAAKGFQQASRASQQFGAASSRSMNVASRAASRGFQTLVRSAKVAGAAFTGLAATGATMGVRLNAQWQSLGTSFETLLGSADQAAKFMEDLRSVAMGTPFRLTEVAEMSRGLLGVEMAAKRVPPTLDAIGKATMAIGGDAETYRRITDAIMAMEARGKLTRQEMTRLAQAGVPVDSILRKGLGLTADEMARVADQGIPASKAVDLITRAWSTRYAKAAENAAGDMNIQLMDMRKNAEQVLRLGFEPLFGFLNTSAMPALLDLQNAAIDIFNRDDLTRAEQYAEVISLIGVDGTRAVEVLSTAASTGAAAVQGGFETLVAVGREIAPLFTQLGSIAGSAFSLVGSLASGAVGPVSALGSGLIALTGGALSVVNELTGVAAALMGLPGVSTAAMTALIGLGASMVALRGINIATSVVGSVTAFTQLAGTVRSASDAMALAGAASPRLGAMLAGIASPAGLAALAIGGVVAGITLLASSGGPSAAERLAEAMAGVARETENARGAIDRFRGAVDTMQDRNLALKGAQAELMAAEEALRQVRANASATAAQRAQAEVRYERAVLGVSRAHRDHAAGQREVAAQAANSVVELANLTTATERAGRLNAQQLNQYRALARSMGLSEEGAERLARQQDQLARTGATTGQRMNALRQHLARVAGQLDDNTTAGREAKEILEGIGSLNDAGLVRFAGRLQQLESEGVPRAQALRQALDETMRDREVRLTAEDRATASAQQVGRALSALNDKIVTITARDAATSVISSIRSAINSIPVERVVRVVTQPVHRRGSPTVYETIDMINALPAKTTKTVAFQPRGSGLMEQATAALRGFDRVLDGRLALERQLAAIDRREDQRAQRMERRRLAREVQQTQRQLRRAKADEKQAARSAANQATVALREFDRQAKVEARRRPLQVRLDRIQLADSAMSELESAMGDVASAIGDALQQGFDRALAGLDAGLETALAGVESTLHGALAAADATLQQTLAGIDTGLQQTLAGIDAGLQATLAAIDQSAEAQLSRAIDAATEAVRAAREQRDTARRIAELTTTRDEASARVTRLEGVLAGARTASERQAAQRLLEDARRAEVEAQEALADAQQDVALAALAAHKETLEEGLQARRDAAEQAATDQRAAAEAEAQAQRDAAEALAQQARDAAEQQAAVDREHHQRLYDQRRAAAEAEFLARRREYDRELGDLREQLRSGEITHQQFMARLGAIYNDPVVRRELDASGRELGLAFSRGLDRSRRDVQQSAQRLASIVRAYLKLSSPAERGPLAYDPEDPGRVLAESFARGMASQRPLIESISRQLAQAAALTVPASAWSSVAAAGRGLSPAGWAATTSVVHNNQRTVHATVPITVEGPEDARALMRRLEWEAMTAGGRF